ncbi:MAG: SLBB domain-containing protein [Acidobacteriaceae bacterium]
MGATGIVGPYSAQNPTGNYTDLGQARRGMSGQGLISLPPQPLTEFQKFIASTTGQVLPIYGADLFRQVPSTFAPLNLTPVPSDYVIGPGDELRIRIWGQVNSQANVQVDRAGEIYLPQVGPVRVAGLPYSHLTAHLRQAIGRVYKNFDLTANLGQIRSIQIYVTGQARRPGVYTVSSLSTLVDALFASGGPSVQGSMRHIELRRGSKLVTDFDLYALLVHGDKSKDVPLLAGDVIFIPPVGPEVAITGSVRNPAIYELRESSGTQALEGSSGKPQKSSPSDDLADLIADAGGVSTVAAEARISVERIANHHDRFAMEVAYDANGLKTVLADGDLVRVFSIVAAYQKTVMLRGNVANPGRFAWHAGMRLSDLIPDQQSLITRDYWWKRAQLGLPGPEFEPVPSLASVRQPTENNPTTLSIPQPGTILSGSQQGESGMQPGQYGQMQSQFGPQLSAQQRGSNNRSSLAEQEMNASGPSIPPSQRIQVRQIAPPIDWSYAVIQRQNPQTLKTELIPFDLGKLVLDHDSSQDLELQAGDVVTIFSQADLRVPIAQQTMLVTLSGEFAHAGVYSVEPGETLRQLVEQAGGLTSNAYLYGSEFTRESTRVMQQARIDEYVQSLSMQIQRSAMAAAASPAAAQNLAGATAAQSNEATLIASLRQIRATGRIVLNFRHDSHGIASIPNVVLRDGDHFMVPSVPATVNVVGAVNDQNSFLYIPGRRVGDYLQMAGGLNVNADRKQQFLIRADGEVVAYMGTKGLWSDKFDDVKIYPGDTIMAPEKSFKPSSLYGWLEYSQLVSNLALGAAVLTVLP